MHPAVRTESEKTLAVLVHDLRQPLSTLEYSVSYLQILLGDAPEAVRQQLRVIERQIDLAAGMISDAATAVSRPVIQRAAAGENRDLTKSATAAVT